MRKYHLRDDEYIVVTASNKWGLAQLHSAILKQAGYTVVQTETKSVSGTYKISATASVSARLFGVGARGDLGAERGGEKNAEVVETRLELDPLDVNDIIAALREIDFNKWIVIEDFHYLPEDTQRDFAVALKAFHESSDLTFIVIGVWLQENRLVQFNGDLSGRVSTINADAWTRTELMQAITEGERILNIEFDLAFKGMLLDSAFESIFVVQESCLLACEEAGVHQRSDDLRKIAVAYPKNLVSRVVAKQSARFSEFIENFAAGFGQTDLEMYRWLLVPVIAANPQELERGLQYRKLRRTLSNVHPRGAQLNAGNVTEALKSTASLQVQQGVKPLVLDYDQSLRRLNVVDRSFLIWLGQQDKNELLELIDVPANTLEVLSGANRSYGGGGGGGGEEEEEEEEKRKNNVTAARATGPPGR